MESTTLPENIRAFILQNIDSIGHLEGLLLLFRNPEMAFGSAAMSHHLYIEERVSARILARLQQLGVAVHTSEGYRYSALPGSDALVRELEQHYVRHLIAITELIHAKSANRIREFSDAFRLRKDR